MYVPVHRVNQPINTNARLSVATNTDFCPPYTSQWHLTSTQHRVNIMVIINVSFLNTFSATMNSTKKTNILDYRKLH